MYKLEKEWLCNGLFLLVPISSLWEESTTTCSFKALLIFANSFDRIKGIC